MIKKIVESLAIIGFVLFVLGGLAMVIIQISGLVLFRSELVIFANNSFSWIFPVAALTGLLAYLYSYLANKE
ncbi:hypothetical protein [Neobacillus sp. LXY-4]|uniref:hypothetical protein n=1 Tax=Neobacillus sp. LXY-4 TaxID=3379826 RepID=UPI003EE30975